MQGVILIYLPYSEGSEILRNLFDFAFIGERGRNVEIGVGVRVGSSFSRRFFVLRLEAVKSRFEKVLSAPVDKMAPGPVRTVPTRMERLTQLRFVLKT